MEKNTVLLSTEDYNELRDFKKYMDEGYTHVSGAWFGKSYFRTTDEEIKELVEKTDKLAKECYELQKNQNKAIAKAVADIKNMGWIELIMWKKS